MKVLLFGATGMVGQGVLRECLQDAEIAQVVSVGRSSLDLADPKLTQIVRPDPGNLDGLEDELAGFDACFYALGASAAGMSEAAYTRINHALPLAAGEFFSRVNPGRTFIYVSGHGTDSTEQGRAMWARVKGRTENRLLALPLDAYMFRPGMIEPLDGIRSKTPLYRIVYALLKPVLPLLHAALPNTVITTRELAQAMLGVARRGYPKRVLEMRDLRALLS